MEKNTIILTVRVDYCHDGLNHHHEETAARMAVKQSFTTIESGVEVARVEVYNNGDEVFTIDNSK